jgi:SPP1 family predicted phage head-tail adaptor
MTINELNTKVTIRSFNLSKDGNGDLQQTGKNQWSKWAKVKQNNGSLLINAGLQAFNESFEIVLRYEQSRPTLADYEIEYKGKKMKVYNARPEKEGTAWWEIINAYTSN